MNREYKIYKITYFLMAVNVITYLYTSLKYGLSMSAMQGIQVGGIILCMFITIMNITDWLQLILFILV